MDKIIEHCKKLSMRKLVHFAKKNYKILYKYLSKRYTHINDHSDLLLGTLYICISANGKLAWSEWEFVGNFVKDFTYEKGKAIVEVFDKEEGRQMARDAISVLPEDMKQAYLNLCIAILCADGRIDKLEKDFLNSLI